MLTKSDFLLFLESPIHLWAEKHGKRTKAIPSPYDLHLMQQGYEVEKVAKDYCSSVLVQRYAHAELLWQPTYTFDGFESRADAVIHDLDTDEYDIYEIKSTTSIKKGHRFDACFQTIVSGHTIKIRSVHLLILNEEYVREDSLDLESLFVAHDITEEIETIKSSIHTQMLEAARVQTLDSPENLLNCIDPKTCSCPDLCHPNLPKISIYTIPMLSEKKKRDLHRMGIQSLHDIPPDYELSDKQSKIVDCIQANKPFLDKGAIKGFFDSFNYPLYFLDYETYGAALPIYPGYKPYQPMVFQFSLHVIEQNNKSYQHDEYLALDGGDPARGLIKHLRKVISDRGSVIVWNKGFEGCRNKEMAAMYPEFSDFLLDLNRRMIDLADIINKGYYIHPDFLGSWSIKNVLPVLAPDLSYKELSIGKGDEAMLAWWDMVNSQDESKKKRTAKELLKYCGLDTLAMVKIWEALLKLI